MNELLSRLKNPRALFDFGITKYRIEEILTSVGIFCFYGKP
ncbi:hypothetical protein QF004_001996 [Chryseobacterium sp. MDT2-18]|nr:hypothetical protein [Chryseobacterium sp. MDT2-18]